MPLHRRGLLVAGSAVPFLAACSTGLWRYRGEEVSALATRLGVCAAVYATLLGGRPQPPVAISGCGAATRADAIFQAASLTKPVAAFAALQLVLSGELDLRAPVSRYLPGGYTHYRSVLRRGPGDPSDPVPAETLAWMPVATLLNHTSGLPNWSSSGLRLASVPGERWRYSGEGYVLLQAVIEAVCGKAFEPFVQEQVFQPLGMVDSSLVWPVKDVSRTVPGQSAGGTSRGAVFRFPVAAASLHTTANDYARFMAAWAGHDRLLALTLSRPVSVDRGLGLAWGYGWGIERTGRDDVLWQWGNNPGFRSFAMFSASSKDGFVILTNHHKGMPLAASLAFQSLPGEHHAFRFRMVG
jgi:CubicO group peptidase (beta-lactamase class C family)